MIIVQSLSNTTGGQIPPPNKRFPSSLKTGSEQIKKGRITLPLASRDSFLSLSAPRQGTKIDYLLKLDKKTFLFFVCYI